MKLIKAQLICVLFVASSLEILAADTTTVFTLANTLQSNMVIQQGKLLQLWGHAKPSSKVIVKAEWETKKYVTKTGIDGNWQVSIPVPNAVPGLFKTNTIQLFQGKQNIELKNILIGDVWLCSGQSNMAMELKPFLPWMLGANNFRLEIQNANYPEIRLFRVRTDFKAFPEEDCEGKWEICSPKTVPDFSALAYFFGRQIFIKKKIPIGLVVSSVGGSACQAWTSREVLANDSVLNKKYLFPYDTSSRSKENIDSVVTFEKVVRPTLFYNAMIFPLRNIKFRGTLWYQGESNRFDSAVYTKLFSKMIYQWRCLFSDQKLPFYYVQVAPYTWQQNNEKAFAYALLREAQNETRKVVDNSEMALTIDIADPNNIHPSNKQELAYRLAMIALANVYKEPNIVFQGPEYFSHIIDKDVIKIKFKNSGSGLCTNDGQEPRFFFIAGQDGEFYPARAIIQNGEIWLTSNKVKNPIAIRYAFTDYPVTNFQNEEGFPAIPFRTK